MEAMSADDGSWQVLQASSAADSPIAIDSPAQDDSVGAEPDHGASPHSDAANRAALLNFKPPPGASVFSPSAEVSNILNPRSCVTCRRRKVRCDKHMPCSNCRRAQIPCVFPAPGRAPRRPRPKDPNAPPPSKHPSTERELELIKRLRKLEGIVEELSGQIELDGARHGSSSNSPEQVSGADAGEAGRDSNPGRAPSLGGMSIRSNQDSPSPHTVAGKSSSASTNPGSYPEARISKKMGRLVLNDKGGRYVSSMFWSKINDELEDLRAEAELYTDEESDEEDEEDEAGEPRMYNASLIQQPGTSSQSFIFGYSSSSVDLRPYHPLPSQIPFLWQVYQENVDPVLKILHVPSMNKLVREARDSPEELSPENEALMFGVYLAAIISMDDAEVKKSFGSEKPPLMAQYRFSLEQALAKANFATQPNLITCQAFLLLLVLVRRHNDTAFVWTMTGLIIRMSQQMGLHRDGTIFPNLTPFEVEMRRRLFWAITMLDLRSAEDQGTDLGIIERTFDTALPLNVNDTDLDPDMTELPTPRVGPTELTFTLIRYEICAIYRKVHIGTSASAVLCPRAWEMTPADREELLMDTYKRIQEQYIDSCVVDDSATMSPMHWVASNIARVIVAKIMLIIYQPSLFPSKDGDGAMDDGLPPEIRRSLFLAATEIFEYSHMLNHDPRSKPWRWLFQTYTQWHAAAYVLLELSRKPWGATSERGWTALNAVFTTPKDEEIKRMSQNSAIWMPFRKLFTTAKKHREAEVTRLRADPQAAALLDLDDRESTPPTSFGHLSGSLKSAIAVERWRKLVHAPKPIPQRSDPAAPLAGPPEKPKAETYSFDTTWQSAQPWQGVGPDVKDSRSAPGSRQNTLPTREQQGATMEYLNEAISQTMDTGKSFNPADLWGLAFSAANAGGVTAESIIRDANNGDLVIPLDNAGVPRIDNHLASAATMPGILRGEPAVQHSPSQGDQQQVGSGNTLYTPSPPSLRGDHDPPWLWSLSTGPTEPSRLPPGGPLVDEVDVNMEEGFDWQNWQEGLRGFEMESANLWGNGL